MAFLEVHSGLGTGPLRDALGKGAVWVGKGEHARLRSREGQRRLRPGDWVAMYHDPAILARVAPVASCIEDLGEYSVWIKPAGQLAQGSDFGDHCALLRQVERQVAPGREALLVHRLDRETLGLMLIAHNRATAAVLSRLFQQRQVTKLYRARVAGNVLRLDREGTLDRALDGRPARTTYRVVCCDPTHRTALIDVEIKSGRHHQIRRHLSDLGFPVVGDPTYGRGNKNRDGLQLVARALAFTYPGDKRTRSYLLDENMLPESLRAARTVE